MDKESADLHAESGPHDDVEGLGTHLCVPGQDRTLCQMGGRKRVAVDTGEAESFMAVHTELHHVQQHELQRSTSMED